MQQTSGVCPRIPISELLRECKELAEKNSKALISSGEQITALAKKQMDLLQRKDVTTQVIPWVDNIPQEELQYSSIGRFSIHDPLIRLIANNLNVREFLIFSSTSKKIRNLCNDRLEIVYKSVILQRDPKLYAMTLDLHSVSWATLNRAFLAKNKLDTESIPQLERLKNKQEKTMKILIEFGVTHLCGLFIVGPLAFAKIAVPGTAIVDYDFPSVL
ncbi:MAG: hypothetical protein H0W88_09525 [Parachlamydiaceae bacterium]|nr:hypothetical protein [Parachlamydiaceae bacterium]